VRAGKLDARPIPMPSIKRTLFLASSKQQGPFKNEMRLTGAVRSSLTVLLDTLGPLAQPLWVRTA
jgi:LysR family nitrogen assimilation transcriptional regulator